MEAVRFEGAIRYFKPDQVGGLAVVDVPAEHVQALGGLRQQRAGGTIGGTAFASSLMPAGGGRLALSVSRAMMVAAGISVGDTAAVEIDSIGRE